jgi:ABC-type sugar transport system substrate-binding protein
MAYSKLRAFGCLALLLLGLFVVAGCGGGGSSSSSEPAPAESEAPETEPASEEEPAEEEPAGEEGEESSATGGVAEAQKFVEEGLATPTEISIKQPVKKAPPKGMTIAYMNCGLPICNEVEAGLKEAIKPLGWTYKGIHSGSTPETLQSAWSEVVQLNPDAVISDGSPAVVFEKELKEYSAEGGVFVNQAVAEEPIVPNSVNIVGEEYFEESGRWLANWVVAKGEEGANAAFFNVSEFPILTTLEKAYDAEYKKLCPSCKSESVTVNAATIGKDLPSRVVSYLQQNPETNFIVPSFGDMALGVPQAMAAAGVNEGVGVISQGDGPTNFEYIANGEQEMALPQPVQMISWMMADAVLRLLNEEEISQEEYERVPHQYITEENLENPSEPWAGVPGFQKQFEELWKVG